MRVFLFAAILVSILIVTGLTNAAEKQKDVCLKVKGEKVEIRNLADKPIVIDREGIPDFVATSMLQSVSSTGKEPKSYNIILNKVKRNAQKAIVSFDVKVNDKAYAYPKNTCKK